MMSLPENPDGRLDGLDVREAQTALACEFENKGMSESKMTDEEQSAETEEGILDVADKADHLRMVEALLFAASEPLADEAIAKRVPEGVDVPGILAVLSEHYADRGINLTKVSGKWRFVTAADVGHILEIEKVEPRRLSRAALETLAIIAYHQPCTRADIEDVRGVQVSKGSLDQLLEIGWVRLRGRRRDAPGRPVLYATSPTFLEHFGLDTVEDLPGMADLKAAGLLDARLPPGFSIPSPSDVDGDEDELDDTDEPAEFSQDFMADDADDPAPTAG